MREVTPLIWADEFGRAQPMTWSWPAFIVGFLVCLAACVVFVLAARAVLQRAALAKAEEHAARLMAQALADKPAAAGVMVTLTPPADPFEAAFAQAVASGAATQDEIDALRRAMGGS